MVGRHGNILLVVFISPIRSLSTTQEPVIMKTSKIWDKFAEGYSKKPIADEASYQKKLQVTQSYLKPHMEVMEFGCGTGGTSLIHSPYVKHILATDISPKMIDIAKQRATDQKITNVEFQTASIDELQIPDNSLDVVLGLSILHLLKNKKDAIHKTYNMLKPGGLFVTSTVCAGDMGGMSIALIKLIMPVGQFFGLLPPFFAFTERDLKKNFRDTGFEIEYEWRPKDENGKPKNDAAVFIIGKKPT